MPAQQTAERCWGAIWLTLIKVNGGARQAAAGVTSEESVALFIQGDLLQPGQDLI